MYTEFRYIQPPEQAFLLWPLSADEIVQPSALPLLSYSLGLQPQLGTIASGHFVLGLSGSGREQPLVSQIFHPAGGYRGTILPLTV